jgi:hypothetical protein
MVVPFAAGTLPMQAAACLPKAKKRTTVSETTLASFEACAKKAHDLGLVPGQAGRIEYMRECMGGRPGSPSSERR